MQAALDMGDVTGPIDQLTTAHSGVFLSAGNDLLVSIAVIVLVIYAMKHGLTGGLLAFLFQYVPLLLVAANLLKYYNSPFPGMGFSVHQAFGVMATDLANQIDIQRMDILFQRIGALLAGLEKPGLSDMVMIPVYFMVEVDMWFIEAILFGMTALGFVMLGIGALLGPIFIPWLIVPRLSWLFWNWIQFMLQYSFYRVVAAALTFIWSSSLTTFLQNTVGGNYSLAQFITIMPRLIVVTFAMAWTILRITAVVSDLFKGSSSGGATPRVRWWIGA